MKTADEYLEKVLASLPRSTPLRDQIGMELRGHIAERLDGGAPVEEVLRQLGDPTALAESYLNAVPLVSAPFLKRAAAKLLDGAVVLAAVALPALFVGGLVRRDLGEILVVLAALAAGLGFVLYTAVAEVRSGQTVGKRVLGLRVVRESGASISPRQAFVRQLPLFLSVFFIDVLFALFTEKRQRAFEMLSKTRVVML